jgi:hypothetical protein
VLGATLSLSPFDQAHGDPEVLEGSKGRRVEGPQRRGDLARTVPRAGGETYGTLSFERSREPAGSPSRPTRGFYTREAVRERLKSAAFACFGGAIRRLNSASIWPGGPLTGCARGPLHRPDQGKRYGLTR